MPRKTTILIIVLVIVTAGLVYLAVQSEQLRQQQVTTQLSPTPAIVAPYASLYFDPATLDLGQAQEASNSSVDIILNTNNQDVSGAQIELSYNPNILTNVAIEPVIDGSGIFSQNSVVLINSVDPSQGRISLAIGINGNEEEVSGTGKVATLTFSAIPSDQLQGTEITFLPKSSVTTYSSIESILKDTTSLFIILQGNNNQ